MTGFLVQGRTDLPDYGDSRKFCKKLSISAGGDRKKLRRLSRMARQDIAKVVGVVINPPAAFLVNSELPCFVTPTFAMMQPR
jgi:hypothetical protein